MAKINGVDPADLTPRMKLAAFASSEKLSMLYAEYRGARAESGRATQMFQKIKRDNSIIGDVDALVKSAERKMAMPFQDIAKVAASFDDPVQFGDFLNKATAATKMEKFLFGWRSAILTGPQTSLANVAGNIMKWVVEIPESTVAATIYAGKRAIGGDPLTLAQYKARAFAPVYGAQMGAVQAIKVMGEMKKFYDEHTLGETAAKAGRLVLGREGVLPGDNKFAEVTHTNPIGGLTGELMGVPFRSLQAQDALFRVPGEYAEAHIMAVDRAVEAGIDPRTREGAEWIAARTADPRLGLEEDAADVASKRVEDAGSEAVYAQRLGPKMEKFGQLLQGSWGQLIIPFYRTPVNLVSWAVQHFPGLNLMSGKWREDYAAGGERQSRAIARVAIGAGLAATALSLSSNGQLTGGGLFDKEEGNAKRAAGWQPYSLQIGDKYYSYQRIEPVAKVLGLAADMADMWKHLKDKGDVEKLTSMMVLMFGNATISTTYLSGLSNAIQSISDPARYGENFMEQYASSLVPKIIGQTVTAADPYKREVAGSLEAIQSQLPFLREKLMPKRDVWGEPVANDKWFDVMPVAVTQKDEDKVKTEAVRLHLALTDAPKFLLERGPFKSKERQIELSAEQRDVMREVTGKWAMDKLARIVNSPDWSQMPDYAKAIAYQKVFEGAKRVGAFKALPPEDAARLLVREAIQTKIQQQIGDTIR
jgi:hypothetical protein